jgi:O2-independent ubiquinone biosynthesis protein UbiV
MTFQRIEEISGPAREFRITVGPVLTYWTRKELMAFYAGVADSAADTVVLGEVVCSRRHEMNLDDWLGLAADLEATGKEVVLATMALLESESDLRQLRRIVEGGRFLVEAGDASALQILAQASLPFVIGPHVNVYGADALRFYVDLGASRWVAPVELPLDEIGRINRPPEDVGRGGRGVPTEVWAFGRLPLAFSARCFTARHHRLRKDDCQFRCADDPDGLLLSTGEGLPFLALNGIQTLSAGQHCLVEERDALRRAGVARLRLSPVSRNFDAVVACFERVMNADGDAAQAMRELADMALPGGIVNGFAHARPGIERVTP